MRAINWVSIFSICMLLLLSGQSSGQSTDSVLAQLKVALDTAEAKNHGQIYLDIARRYLEYQPDQDSFTHYLGLLRVHAQEFESQELLFQYNYYSGVRQYRSGDFERAMHFMDKATELSHLANDSNNIARMFYARGVIQSQMQDGRGFEENLFKALNYAEAIPNRSIQVTILIALGIEAGHQDLVDQQNKLLDDAYQYFDQVSLRSQLNLLTNLGVARLKKYDQTKDVSFLSEARRYINQGLTMANASGNKMAKAKLWVDAMYIRLLTGDNKENLYALADSLTELGEELEDPFYIQKGLANKAMALTEMGRPREALALENELIQMSEILVDPIHLRFAYQVLARAAREAGAYEKALQFNDQFLVYHDSISQADKSAAYAEVLEKYEAEKKANAILRLEQEKMELEQKALFRSAKTRQHYLVFGVGFMLLLLCTLVAYYLQQQRLIKARVIAATNEQRLLRSQMNPHFLFNALNSIKRFYVDGRVEEANDFLADFGSLLRQILEQSSKPTTTIEEELNFLELYLKLEQRRLRKKLSYEIQYDPDKFDYNDSIPSLILQPLVENSIWHGIMKSDRDGRITISIEKQNGSIRCVVQDNGIGYHSLTQNNNTGRISRGLQLIRERIKERGQLNIQSLKDSTGTFVGTEVELIFT